MQSLTGRYHRHFQSKPTCCIRLLCERRRIKENILFYMHPTAITMAAEVKKFGYDFRIFFKYISFIRSDENTVILGRNSGFVELGKIDVSRIFFTHLVLYRRTLPIAPSLF